jgi:hypothetical protein
MTSNYLAAFRVAMFYQRYFIDCVAQQITEHILLTGKSRYFTLVTISIVLLSRSGSKRARAGSKRARDKHTRLLKIYRRRRCELPFLCHNILQ